MVLTDLEIHALASGECPILSPYIPETRRVCDVDVWLWREGTAISYGQGPMAYDTRLEPNFKVFRRPSWWRRIWNWFTNYYVDPKNYDEKLLVEEVHEHELILYPGDYALGVTVETFHMPDDVIALCVAKSTYARLGIGVNTTPVHPGFRGQVVIEFCNQGHLPVKIYTGEGFAQFIFHRSSEPCGSNYKQRGGVYQEQSGVQKAKTARHGGLV